MTAFDQEEEKGLEASPQLRQKRNRLNSINGLALTNGFGKSQLPSNVFASISAALGGDDG